MTTKNGKFVTHEVKDGVANLTFNRPPVNVIHIPLIKELITSLDQLTQDEKLRVLILRSEGKMFSAGVDVADHTADKVGEMIPLFDQVCQKLSEFPVPTLAAVQGHALGGGCELVLCSDLAVMAEGAKIGQPEIKLAVFAPVAALRLSQLVGYRAAADLMFTGRNMTAREALEVGLVNAVVPNDQMDDWVQGKVDQLRNLSRAALILAKRAFYLGTGKWSKDLPEVERLYLDKLMATADANEGLEAFMEKRQPEWQHR